VPRRPKKNSKKKSISFSVPNGENSSVVSSVVSSEKQHASFKPKMILILKLMVQVKQVVMMKSTLKTKTVPLVVKRRSLKAPHGLGVLSRIFVLLTSPLAHRIIGVGRTGTELARMRS
jgi:hypothetical protein